MSLVDFNLIVNYTAFMKNGDKKIITTLLSGKVAKKYEGKQVVVCGGKVHILPRDDKKANSLLNKLIKQYHKID